MIVKEDQATKSLKMGNNLRQELVLQDSVSLSELVQIAVLPPFWASLQLLDLLRVWDQN